MPDPNLYPLSTTVPKPPEFEAFFWPEPYAQVEPIRIPLKEYSRLLEVLRELRGLKAALGDRPVETALVEGRLLAAAVQFASDIRLPGMEEDG